MSKFYLTPESRDDLDQIWFYIAKDNPNAANKFEDELLSSIFNLSDFPNIGHRREDLTKEPVRFYIFKNYVVVYEPDQKPIRIIRILSTYRDLFNIL